MDWTSLLAGGPFASLAPQLPAQPQPAQPQPDASSSALPGAPLNIQPTAQFGILNGQQRPKDQDGQLALLAQAQKLLAPPAMPSLPQIQMAKPPGSQGINPMQFLAAFGKNPLSAISGVGA